MTFTTIFRVHWVDTDASGVMHYSNYFRYFEACEQEFYHSLGKPFKRILEDYNVMLPRVESHCEYRAACRSDDEIEVTLQVREVTPKTVTLDFKIQRIRDRKLAAKGYVKCIAVNQEWKVVELPADLSKALLDSTV